jgi:hypothetical protein
MESINKRKFKIVNIILNKSLKSGSLHLFDDNIIHIILKHYWKLLDTKHTVLLDWIPIDKLEWSCLSRNPNAIDLLEKNIDKIDWNFLSGNKNAIHILEQHTSKINWDWLSSNPSIFEEELMPKII